MKKMKREIINVLLVEDNPVDARLAQEVLKHCRLYQSKTTLVDSLAGAKKHLGRNNPDTILLDLGLPDSKGLETFFKIREVAPDVPVVILSGSGDRDTALTAVRNGAKDYLIKSPESYEYLDRAIRYAVEGGRIERIIIDRTEKLQEVAEAAVQLADADPEEDINVTITKSLRRLSGAMLTHISIVKEGGLLSIQYIDGLPKILAKTVSLLGIPIEGLEFELNDDIFTDLRSGKSRLTNKLSESVIIPSLTPGKLNKIQKLLGIGESLFLPLQNGNTLVGICSVVFEKNSAPDEALSQFLTVFTNAAAVALQRHETQRQLSESEEKYRSVVEHANDGIVIIQDKLIVYANKQASEILQKPMENIIGTPYFDGLTPEAQTALIGSESLLMSGGSPPANLEVELVSPEGQHVLIEINATLIRHQNRPAANVILRDVTERKQAELLLRDREARLAEAQRIAHIGNWSWNIAEGGDYWSDEIYRIFGHKPQEYKATFEKFMTAVHPDDRDLVTQSVDQAMKGKPYSLEHRIVLSDGQVRTLHGRGEVAFDSHGKPNRMVGTLQDITERKQAIDKISADAKELRQLIETANAPIIGIDNDGRVNEWNGAVANLTGFTKDEVMGQDLVGTRITEDFRASVKAVLDKALKGEETANYEFPLLTKTGERLIILLNASTRRDMAGNIVGVLGRGQDITELDKYRASLEQMVEVRTAELKVSLADIEVAKNRIDNILKSIGDGLIVTDLSNRVILMNRVAEETLGVHFNEIVNQPIELAIEDKTLRERIVTTLGKQTTGYVFDFELPDRESQQSHIMRARTSVIIDRDGQQSGIITIIHDVSHEREVDRMKTEFISTAAHELRTPLTSIQGFSEILMTRDDLEEGEREKFLGHINRQATALAVIIDDLLDISRIESGRGFALNLESCDAGSAIQSVVGPFTSQSKGHSFIVSLPEKARQLIVDKDKMEQLLENLISNAVKYSPEGSEIKVIGEVRKGWYDIIIEDEGIGMTHEQLGHIYDKFYRADSSNTAAEGTGLGMSIVKAIIDAHGGKIDISSEVGVGTKVTVSLPIPIDGPAGDEITSARAEGEKLDTV